MNFNYILVLQVIHKGGLIMTTISLRVNDDESKLIHDYVSVNQLNMSQFIRDAVLDKIENDLDLDEDRILYAFEKAKQEKTYDHTEVWKIDKQTVRVIKNWVIKNLVNTPDPRLHGKALKGNLKGIWRYRVGDYRLFASIEEDIITIRIFEVGHRRDVYKK